MKLGKLSNARRKQFAPDSTRLQPRPTVEPLEEREYLQRAATARAVLPWERYVEMTRIVNMAISHAERRLRRYVSKGRLSQVDRDDIRQEVMATYWAAHENERPITQNDFELFCFSAAEAEIRKVLRGNKDTISEWFRVLKPGGQLIIECPHFDLAVQEYLAGNENRLINIFGRQRSYGDAHLYGYNPERLIHILEEIGFRDCIVAIPHSSQSLDEPSFRVECIKPADKRLPSSK